MGKHYIMKQLMILCSCAMVLSGGRVAAQSFSMVTECHDYLRSIPKELVSSQSPRIFSESYDESTGAKFVFLDDTFQTAKTLENISFGSRNSVTVIERLDSIWNAATQSFTREWVELQRYVDEEVNTPVDIDYYNVGFQQEYNGGEGYPFTQTVFNTDENYEFVYPDYKQSTYVEERDRDGDGEIDYRETWTENHIVGFKIVNDKGVLLSSVTLPASDWDFSEGIDLWQTSSGFYMAFYAGSRSSQYENKTVIYKVEPESASVKMVNSFEGKMKVSPNVTKRSMPVTVYLNKDEDIDAISVFDTMGRKVMTVPTHGEKQIQLATSALRKGMYIVKASDGNEACKIIIR